MAGDWSLTGQGWQLNDWSLLYEDTETPSGGPPVMWRQHRRPTWVVDDDEALILFALQR